MAGQWKLFVDHGLLIDGTANPKELYELRSDLQETDNRIDESDLQPLVRELTRQLQQIHDRGRLR